MIVVVPSVEASVYISTIETNNFVKFDREGEVTRKTAPYILYSLFNAVVPLNTGLISVWRD